MYTKHVLCAKPFYAATAHYEKKISECIDQLDNRIEADAVSGRASNVTDLFWFGVDAMGEFVLDKSFSMLHNEETHYIIKSMQSALSSLGAWGSVPWVA